MIVTIKAKSVMRAFAVAALLGGGMPVVAGAQTVELKMASGYPDSNYLTQTVKGFITDAEKRSNGQLKVVLHNNQSLVKLQDIMRAVQTNQVALGDVRLGNHGNQDPVYIVDAIPFLASDYDSALRLWQASKAYLSGSFAKRGLKILFAMWNPPQGFYTQKPIDNADDLAGLKLRIYSSETRRMGELLKSEPLIVQFGEVPQAFSTGLIDAMFTSPQTGIDTQAWDFTKNLTMVGALYTKQLVIINQETFDKLPKSSQEAIDAAAAQAEKDGFARMKKITDEQLALIKSKGLVVTQGSPKLIGQLKKIGAIMEQDWKDRATPEQRKVLDHYYSKTH